MAKREVVVELQLGDTQAVSRLGRLEIETKQYQRELRALNAEIAKNGSATQAQTVAVGELNARIRANQTVIRELKNDLSGATAAGLRFRDKMAEASRAGLGAFGLEVASVAGGVTLLAGVMRDAARTIAEFDSGLARIKALGGEYRDNIDGIAEAAKTAGTAFGFTASESLSAVEALAKAGVSAEQILGGGLQGALVLAASGSMNVGEAAEIAANAMTQFGLSGSDVSKVADLLSAGANKATGDVGDFAQALKQSGLVAAQFGVPIEEAVGTLTAFASAGLLGSDAGTSFRTMLLRLAKPSGEAADTMKQLGINAFNAQGQFVGIESLAGQLQERMSSLTEEQRNAALSTIFGSDAIRAASILYQQGASGISEWTQAVNEQGFAAKVAAEQQQTLAGSVNQLRAAWEGFILSIEDGSGVIGQALTSMIGRFTDLLNALTRIGTADGFLNTVDAIADSFEKLGGIGVVVEKWRDWLGLDIDQDAQAAINSLSGVKRASAELVEAVKSGDRERIASAQEAFNKERALEMDRIKAAAMQVKLKGATVEQAEADTEAAKATDKRTEATRKLTEAQKAQLEQQAKLQEEMRKSAEEPIERMQTRTPTLRTPLDSEDETFALFGINTRQTLESNVSELTALRQAFFESELTGLRDFNMERALLESEYLNGSIASKEDYLRRAQAINDAEVASSAMKLQSLANVSGALAALFGEQSAEAKAAATTQALINTYLGATQALRDPTIPSTFARIAAMASIIITGLAQVKKIQGFADGGYTSKRGSDHEEVGVVHANEWVAPAWQTKHPSYAPVIKWLENARRRRGMPGAGDGFFSGGPVGASMIGMQAGPTLPAGAMASADLSRAIMNMPPPVVSVEEIRDVQGRVNAVERISRL